MKPFTPPPNALQWPWDNSDPARPNPPEFRRRPASHAHRPGTPTPADPCRCGTRARVFDDTCIVCGHYPAAVVHNTWANRQRT